MGKNSRHIRDIAEARETEKYEAFRKDVDPGRLGLALQAIRQRVDQDLMIAVAAYEIDCALEDTNHRIQRNPKDALVEINAIKARLDVVDTLMEKYEAEYLELHPEIAEQMEAAAAESEIEFTDPTTVDGWETVEESAPVEDDPASSEE
jgi:hypothetical protein